MRCETILQSVDNEKYLGVMLTLTSDLSWSLHISNITTKTNQKLGFSKGNLKGSPKDLKKLAYIAFVRSGLEFACSVWDPHLVTNKDKLERVQMRAGSCISNQYGQDIIISVVSLLNQLRLESLEERRRIYRLTFMYKILKQHLAVSPSDLDLLYNTRPVRGSVSTKRLRTIRCQQTAYQESFAPKTVVQWNGLQDTITSAASVPSFRSQQAPKTRP